MITFCKIVPKNLLISRAKEVVAIIKIDAIIKFFNNLPSLLVSISMSHLMQRRIESMLDITAT